LEPRKGLETGRGSRERDELGVMVLEAEIVVEEGLVGGAGSGSGIGVGTGVGGNGNGSARGRWIGKMKFGASRDRSGS